MLTARDCDFEAIKKPANEQCPQVLRNEGNCLGGESDWPRRLLIQRLEEDIVR